MISSPAVAGEREVVELFLVQKPTVPEVLVLVIVPLHAMSPEELVMVHPVAELPPAMSTSIVPSACRLRSVLAELIVAAAPKLRVVVEAIPRVALVVRVVNPDAVMVVSELASTMVFDPESNVRSP